MHFQFLLLGNPNASIPTPQPVRPRPMFGAFGTAVGSNSVVFISQVEPPHSNHQSIIIIIENNYWHSGCPWICSLICNTVFIQ